MTLTTALLIAGICLLAEGFFSGAELALISADRVLLRSWADRGGHRATLVRRFLDDPGQLISTALVGTNICVVLSTVVATLALLQHFPQRGELLSLLVMTPLVLIFGEIVPKSVFQHYADRWAPRVIYLLSAFRLLFFPLVALGSWITRQLLRVVHLDQQRLFMSRDELRLLITLPSRSGPDRITADEQQMISRIFKFSEQAVAEVMVPLSGVTALPLSAPRGELVRVIAEKRHTRIPLYRERLDQIEGIVHAFDVLRADPGTPPSALFRPAIFVPESQPARDTLVRLQREGQGMAVVVDEYGGAVGVVTIEDLLEQVVGEIEDEHDPRPIDLIRQEGPGRYRVKGRATVEAFNQVARVQLPVDSDYESVAGLVLDRCKTIPTAGQRLQLGGTTITVIAATDRSVEELEIVVAAKSGR
ncbi:MAG: HlyC/CorC family transporter [Proteobacteria bacterium]|nr:HlyC/CorC family transporter [Pseudomonadota bacterium]